jgi:hypothetical protein
MANAAVTLFTAGVTAALTIVGLYLAHGYRRQVRMRLADRRLESYGKLWALMEIASPHREDVGEEPISADERRELHHSVTSWYYQDGNGMLLNRDTRQMYLTAKYNLVCHDEDLLPPALGRTLPASQQERERRRGKIATRQLSLLRSQMRADLAIYVRPFHEELNAEDVEFLSHCRVCLFKRPWRSSRGPHRRTLGRLLLLCAGLDEARSAEPGNAH